MWIATLRVARIGLGGPPWSSSFGDEKRVSALVLGSAARAEVVLAAVRGEGCGEHDLGGAGAGRR